MRTKRDWSCFARWLRKSRKLCRGDATRLRQVVLNLIGNAIKFTDKGEVALKVQLASETGVDSIFHFIVSDTGIGIPEEKQKLIFSAFSQADASTTRKYGGTGLGLTISTRLVEKMGGKIWVESEVGRGTQFHFTAADGSYRYRPDWRGGRTPCRRSCGA